MELGYLNQVKTILKALVLSSPDKITVEKLNRDYREMEGESIPFRRLGFNNLELFLRSIPDTLLVLGSGHSACVYFVSNDNKSSHIHQMVMQQRKSKPKARTRSTPHSRLGRGVEMHAPPVQTSGRNNNKFQAGCLPKRSLGQQFSPFQAASRNVVTRTAAVKTVSANSFQLNTNRRQLSQHPTDVGPKLSDALPQPKGIDINLSPNVNQQKNEPKNQTGSTMEQAPQERETLSPNKTKISTELANSRIYEQQIKHLLNLLSTTCHVTETTTTTVKGVSFSPETKCEISDNKSKIPKNENDEEQKVEEEMRLNAEANNETAINEFRKMINVSDAKVIDMDEAVPEFAANIQVFRIDFPKNSVSYGQKIPPCQIPDNVDVGSCVGIFIAEIHNPFKFWFHIHKDEHELDSLMSHIERGYNNTPPNDLRIPIMCLNPGQICAASYNGIWHRAEIVAPPVENKIKVFFLDYGTVSEVDINDIKYLASCFAQLPAQALRGSLSHIKPQGLHWSHEATMHFLSSVSEILLFAKITAIDREKSIFYMVLCDTHGDEVIQINRDLVVKQYALYNEDWQEDKINQNNGRRTHHPREDYPTFSMIESGEYPSLTELIELGQRGIDYELIHDRIISNKCAILNFNDNVPEPIRQLPFLLQTSNPFRTDILFELTGIQASF